MPRDPDWYRDRLAPPRAPPRVVIDTDAANEIDDPFAIAWALRSSAQLRIEAVYAAPWSFAHRRALYPASLHALPVFDPPALGMERSHAEIVAVFEALGVPSAGRVLRGSTQYLRSLDAPPSRSEAVAHLIETALAAPADDPLYVAALGCPTNVAAALLLAPEIAERIVVVWTSGYPSHAPHVNDSFNLEQDLLASKLLLDSGVPLVYLPGFHVGAQLRLSWPEVEAHVAGRGAIGAHLLHRYTHNPLWPLKGITSLYAHSWVIWDLIVIAWLIDARWLPSTLVPTPRLDADRRWRADASRHPMREAHAVDRDAIFRDFFVKLETAP
jgi:inosine-uridine nucleoside N-ribohydrolase